jgi:AraC-like DNA-binding protein
MGTDGRDLLEAARAVIGRRLDEPDFVVGSLADKLGLSKRTLQRRLQAQQTDFTSELAIARVQRALDLMRLGVPIDEVARRVGYKHTTHFRARFRKVSGQPTGEVIEALRLRRRSRRSLKRNSPQYYRRRQGWAKRQARVRRLGREFESDLARRHPRFRS